MAQAGAAGKSGSGEPAGMDKAALRPMLKFARQEPVHMAFALGGDGKAILQMDKRKQPRALEKTLKEAASDSRNHRFGTMKVPEDDPKLARFTVNKPTTGMSRKLIVVLKGSGLNKVEIVLEDGSAVESHQ